MTINMRRWVYVTAAGTITVGLVFWLVCANLAESAFHYPEGKCECGRLSYISKIPVLEVWGEPEQIGQAMARLGVVPAERLRYYPRELFFAVLPRVTPAEWSTRAWQELLAAGQRLIANMPERYRREYESLRKHVPEAWHEGLLAGNTLFDIKRVVHCSAVIVQVRPVQGDANSQASLLLGRNLDFPTLGYLHKYSLVSVYRPRDRYAFVAVGFPGMIGVLSGMNEHGLCVAMLEVYESGDGSPPFDAKGIPYAVCLRQLLEECRTVEEAERRLREMPHTCYYNLAICDTRTGGVFEVSPGRICFRGLEQGLCACTNTFLSEPLQVKDGKNWYRSRERLTELLSLREQGSIEIADVHRVLHRANLGAVTMHTMIFEPLALRLHLAMGSCPSSALPLVRLDLRQLLKPEERPH